MAKGGDIDESVSAWAAQRFQDAHEQALIDLARTRGELTLSGAIRGSRAVFQLIDVYLRCIDDGLNGCMEDLPNRVQTRGSEWASAIAAIESALDDNLAKGPAVIARTHGGHYSDPSSSTLQGHYQASAAKLKRKLNDYRHGWTAPAGKSWHERHPMWWAAIQLVLAAIAGATASWLIDRSHSQPEAPVQPSPRPAPGGPA